MDDIELRVLDPLDPSVTADLINLVRTVRSHDMPELPPPFGPRLRLRLVTPNPIVNFYRTVAVHDGKVVGHVELSHELENNTHLMWVDIEVLPEYRGQGIGTQLLEHAEKQAHEAGVRTLFAEVAYDFVPAPDRGSPGKAFAENHGFTVGQATFHGIKDMRFNDSDEFTRVASNAAELSNDYETIPWEGHVPEELINGYCYLKGRMVTDSPSGELDIEKEEYTPELIRADENGMADRGIIKLGTVARHKSTGALAGLTEILVMLGDEYDSHIRDTIVDPDHRGHRIGSQIKIVNEQQLLQRRPAMHFIHTWNADTNGPMLAVNEALGYRTYCTDTDYQKKLSLTD